MKRLAIKSLDKGWCDVDIVMLHACFQLLEDCIVGENLFESCDWTESADDKQKLLDLYNWWQNRKINTDDLDTYEEDNEKLIALIKVRNYLWT